MGLFKKIGSGFGKIVRSRAARTVGKSLFGGAVGLITGGPLGAARGLAKPIVKTVAGGYKKVSSMPQNRGTGLFSNIIDQGFRGGFKKTPVPKPAAKSRAMALYDKMKKISRVGVGDLAMKAKFKSIAPKKPVTPGKKITWKSPIVWVLGVLALLFIAPRMGLKLKL